MPLDNPIVSQSLFISCLPDVLTSLLSSVSPSLIKLRYGFTGPANYLFNLLPNALNEKCMPIISFVYSSYIPLLSLVK